MDFITLLCLSPRQYWSSNTHSLRGTLLDILCSMIVILFELGWLLRDSILSFSSVALDSPLNIKLVVSLVFIIIVGYAGPSQCSSLVLRHVPLNNNNNNNNNNNPWTYNTLRPELSSITMSCRWHQHVLLEEHIHQVLPVASNFHVSNIFTLCH